MNLVVQLNMRLCRNVLNILILFKAETKRVFECEYLAYNGADSVGISGPNLSISIFKLLSRLQLQMHISGKM